MYWTDTGSINKIETASMDGTGRRILHFSTLTDPYGITLDIDTQTLYWTDISRNVIERSKTDGTNREILINRMTPDPYFITYYDGNLYWGDFTYNRLLTTPVSSPNNVAFFAPALGADVYGIHVISPEQQRQGKLKINALHQLPIFSPVSNPCTENNGNCSHLCLLSSISPTNYSCGCPDGLINVNTDNENLCKRN